MSYIAMVLFAVMSSFLISRFGKRAQAQDALTWWAMLAFLGVAVVAPRALRPIADLLGVQVISNFVMATMIMLLVKIAMESAMRRACMQRTLRAGFSTLAAREFLNRRALLGESGMPRVLVLLPSHNEAENLFQMIRKLRSLDRDFPADELGICFVDDGSSDGSLALLQEHAPNWYATHATNLGVAGALLTGFKIAQALGCEYVVQCDADGQHPVDRIPDLIAHADQTSTDLLIGSRFCSRRNGPPQDFAASTSLSRVLGARILRGVLRTFGPRTDLKDPTSGFRVYSRGAVTALLSQIPDEYPEPESIALALMAGLSVGEFPVDMSRRLAGVSSLTGTRALQYMIKVTTALVALRLRIWDDSRIWQRRRSPSPLTQGTRPSP